MEKQVSTKVDWSKDPALLSGKVQSLLDYIGVDLSHRAIFLDPDSMNRYWTVVFTDKTVDPVNNNEAFEFYGDANLKYTFPMWLYNTFGSKINQKNGTLLLNYYMSTEKQAEFARRLGLIDYVRYDPGVPGINDIISENLFEAFVGGLNNISNDKVGPGLGVIYVTSLLMKLFQNEQVDPEKIQKDEVTQLKELFDKMRWGNPVYKRENSNKPYLGEFKVEVRGATGKVLGVGYGSYKKSKLRAAKDARDNLSKEGITVEFADKAKLETAIRTDPEFAKQNQRFEDAIKKINERLVAQGRLSIVKHKFTNVQTGTQGRFGVNLDVAYTGPDGKLAWTTMDNMTGTNSQQIRIALMKKIADYYDIPA